MKFSELIKLPVIRTIHANDGFKNSLYGYDFLLPEPYADTQPAENALCELNAKIDILYQDDNWDQGGEVIVLYLNESETPTLVYQVGDSWSEESQIFILDKPSYELLRATLARHYQQEEVLHVFSLDDEVPNLFNQEPRLIDGQLWHPRGTPRKYSNW